MGVGLCDMLQRVLTEDRWLIMHWRPQRGIVTRCLAASLWNSIVVAVLGVGDSPTNDVFSVDPNLFLRDCNKYRERVVPLCMCPGEALSELQRFGWSPHVIATAPRTAQELHRDLTLVQIQAPNAMVIAPAGVIP
jgi:hypothetical protein